MRSVYGLGLMMVAGFAAVRIGAAPQPVPASPPVPPQAAMSLIALKQLEPGMWQIDVYGKPPKLSCVTDAIELVQLEHDQPNCSRFVVANEPKSATVHYSCQGAGWGRTTIRVETAHAAAIQTQGIAHNAPFDYAVTAHRVGACNQQALNKPR